MYCYSKSTRLFSFISSIFIHIPNEFPSRNKYKERSEMFSSSAIFLIFLQSLQQHSPHLFQNLPHIFAESSFTCLTIFLQEKYIKSEARCFIIHNLQHVSRCPLESIRLSSFTIYNIISIHILNLH